MEEMLKVAQKGVPSLPFWCRVGTKEENNFRKKQDPKPAICGLRNMGSKKRLAARSDWGKENVGADVAGG